MIIQKKVYLRWYSTVDECHLLNGFVVILALRARYDHHELIFEVDEFALYLFYALQLSIRSKNNPVIFVRLKKIKFKSIKLKKDKHQTNNKN